MALKFVLRNTNKIVKQMSDNKDKRISEQASIIQAQGVKIQELHGKLVNCLSQPYGYATVLEVVDTPDPALFLTDKQVRKVGSTQHLRGKIVTAEEGEEEAEGKVKCAFGDESDWYHIGTHGPAEVRIIDPKGFDAEDGSSISILIGDKPIQLTGCPELKLNYGDTVLTIISQDAPPKIIKKTNSVMPGATAEVVNVLENKRLVVQSTGSNASKCVIGENVKVGDSVVLDHLGMVVIDVIPKKTVDFKVAAHLNVSWDDIGGLVGAKKSLRQVIEWPVTRKSVFEHYGTPTPKGVLLYGPPGCGKTLCGKACFTSLAKLHGADVQDTGFIYCKGPEILDKFVGNSELAVRQLFRRGEEHYKTHGYPALLFIDEADAILRKRGSGMQGGVIDSIVPQFLSEMDGLESSHTIVMLASNRPDMLDPAVVRDGRIDRRIKIKRPNEATAQDILEIHLKAVPLWETSVDEICSVMMSEVFSSAKGLYRINGEHMFTLGDALSGGMLKGFVDEAKMFAIDRDSEDSLTGVSLMDFKASIEKIYHSHQDVSHDYDVQDFAEENGITGELSVVKMNDKHGDR